MEMEMEMEMVAAVDVNVNHDLTPPLHPLAYSLHDSFLFSHCAACFSPLPHPHPHPPFSYCSSSCSSSHSPLHLSSASHHLHLLPFNGEETSDLRLALILLLQIKSHQPLKQYHRICGLMTNRHKLLDDHEFSAKIKTGARAMAAATIMRDGALDSKSGFLLEEAVLCLVITNAVEVQDRFGRSVGVAVYDISFSWINHSCSPNACYRFLPPEGNGGGQRCLITPSSSHVSDFLTGWAAGGPRIVVRSMKVIKKGEQVTIAYTDLLQPKELRQLELWSKYRFTCCCRRCVAVPQTYVDQRLQEICASSSNGRRLRLGIEELTEYIDDGVGDYISSNDAESCCKKLENVLLNGFHYEGSSVIIVRLHPQHYLSLKCYTTLASAYKVRAMDENNNISLQMNRFSAAYSLLLALVTHNLFVSESCLIKSVSYFWIGAGEAVVNVGRSCMVMLASSGSSSYKCSRCGLSLIDMFEGDDKDLDMISKEFLKCMSSDITGKVWKYLVDGNGYLEVVKDPMIKHNNNNNVEEEGIIMEEVFAVGGHCLLYGGILSNISEGKDSHLSCYVRHLLHSVKMS